MFKVDLLSVKACIDDYIMNNAETWKDATVSMGKCTGDCDDEIMVIRYGDMITRYNLNRGEID